MDQLTQPEVQRLFHYDQETGVFIRRITTNSNPRAVAGSVVGAKHKDGYLTVKIGGTLYMLHRIAWLYVHGRFPEKLLDHANGQRSDNRLCNLRECNHSQNGFNMRAKPNSSGVKGVSWAKNRRKWKAQICANYKDIVLGYFEVLDDAKKAYADAATKYHGAFARLD